MVMRVLTPTALRWERESSSRERSRDGRFHLFRVEHTPGLWMAVDGETGAVEYGTLAEVKAWCEGRATQ